MANKENGIEKVDAATEPEKKEDQNNNDPKPEESTKKEKKDKENIFIRGIKKTGSVICGVGKAVNNFAHEHVYIFGGGMMGLGALVLKGYEILTASESSDDVDTSDEDTIALLPSGEEDNATETTDTSEATISETDE